MSVCVLVRRTGLAECPPCANGWRSCKSCFGLTSCSKIPVWACPTDRANQFASRFHADGRLSSPQTKSFYFVFSKYMVQLSAFRSDGAYAFHERRAESGGRVGADRRAVSTGRAKSCGPGAPRSGVKFRGRDESREATVANGTIVAKRRPGFIGPGFSPGRSEADSALGPGNRVRPACESPQSPPYLA
jgi:hypothetical protein